MPETPARPHVIAILGSPRSGSTLLERLLAAATGATALGEVCYLWERGVVDDQLCGCGDRFSTCSFWAPVMASLAGGDGDTPADAPALADSMVRTCRTRMIPSILGARRLEGHPRRYADAVREVLVAACRQAGAPSLIDSSKHPPHVAVLLRLAREGAIALSLVHVVRDPRAVAFSSLRHVIRPEVWRTPTPMPRYSPWHTARTWIVAQTAAAWLTARAPSVRVRYEDLVGRPAGTVGRVAAAAGLAVSPDAVTGATAVLGTDHTVSGNPSRFRTGPVRLDADDEWRTGLSAAGRLTVTVATLPLLLAYGYPARGGSVRSDPSPTEEPGTDEPGADPQAEGRR